TTTPRSPRSTLLPYTPLFRSFQAPPAASPAQSGPKPGGARPGAPKPGARPGGPGQGGQGRPSGQGQRPGGGAPRPGGRPAGPRRSEEHTSELQSREKLVCRLL